jgi:hypothetical protein
MERKGFGKEQDVSHWNSRFVKTEYKVALASRRDKRIFIHVRRRPMPTPNRTKVATEIESMGPIIESPKIPLINA